MFYYRHTALERQVWVTLFIIRSQGRPHLCCQFLGAVWLSKQLFLLLVIATFVTPVPIARREQYLEPRLLATRLLCQDIAAHPLGQADIGKEQIEPLPGSHDRDGGRTILGLADGVAELGEAAQRHPPERGVVVDQQDRFTTPRQRRGVTSGGSDSRAFTMGSRQIEPYRGAHADLAVDIQVSARLFGKAIDHTQAKTGSLAVFLGRKNRLYRALDNFGRHAGPGVAH